MNTPFNKQHKTTIQDDRADHHTDRKGRVNDQRERLDPRLVIRGESLEIKPKENVQPFAAHVDFLNVTFPILHTPDFEKDFLEYILSLLGLEGGIVAERPRGLHGWKRSFEFEGCTALYGTGGQRGRALLSLPGEACARISRENWQVLVALLDDTLNARITRWDGAVDDFLGIHSVDWAVEQYLAGNFSTGGSRPGCKNSGNWTTPDTKGRTFYVGSRKNGKLLRVYEKGKQLGGPNHPWVRWELELHNQDREIPWRAVLNPGPYVAGAYKATHWISEEACRVKTANESRRIGYSALVQHAHNAYGPLIDFMMKVEGSAEKVVKKLIRPGVPKRLDIQMPPEYYFPIVKNPKDDS